MRKLFLLLLFPIISLAQGIKFENATLYQLLSKAKSENKIIFIDAYASWCGPCKLMSNNIFTDASVGKFYNSNFINAKIDMEKGEGIDIAKDYAVDAYPTLLYLDGTGKVIHKVVGYQNAEEFIKSGEIAINPDKQLSKQIEKYKSGNRNPEFLYELANNALTNKDENAKIYARAYYKAEKNLLKYDAIALMYETIDSPLSEEFTFLQKNEAEASKIVGKDFIFNKLDDIAMAYAVKQIDDKATTAKNVATVESVINKFRPNRGKVLSSFVGMQYAEYEKDYPMYEKYALIYVDSSYKKLDYTILNTAAWTFFEHVKNQESLEKALKWAIESVAVSSNFYNNDTVANLYYKLGDKNNARIYAEISIKLGKETGEDTTETEKLLQKLK
jgi:thiol-disulfide isomerase/thioredoxin